MSSGIIASDTDVATPPNCCSYRNAPELTQLSP